jgi:hypothetical protein
MIDGFELGEDGWPEFRSVADGVAAPAPQRVNQA